MQVQQRRLHLSRARVALACVALPLLAAACAQPKAQTQAPELAQSESAVDLLRRENAALRNRLQGLEERVRLLESGGGGNSWGSTSLGSTGGGYESYRVDPGPDDGGWAEPEGDGPRQLPVVKLTPNERSSEHRAAAAQASKVSKSVRPSSSISLSALPNSGAPEHYDSAYVDARAGEDEGSIVDQAPVDDDGREPASYRLVGSKLVQATQRTPSTSGRPSDRDSGVAKHYKAAMAVYREGRYAEAEQAFASIVSGHPNHDYADNALYWQGEAAYDQAHYADALAAFTTVVERYGGGNKAPDALLKIGLCYGRLGDAANARDVLTQLVAAYPRAEASKIAKRKLADLGD